MKGPHTFPCLIVWVFSYVYQAAAPQKVLPMTKCKDCGTSIPPDDVYCDGCICPQCRGSNQGGWGLCDDCQDIADEIAADERREELRDLAYTEECYEDL